MKFSDGYWRVREGFTAAWARQTYSVRRVDDGLRVLASAGLVHGDRGATLGGPVFTVSLSTPAEGVIRVVEEHYRGRVDNGPHFRLNVDENAPFEIFEEDGATGLRSGDLEAVVSAPGEIFSLDFRSGGKTLTGTSYKGLGVYGERLRDFDRNRTHLDPEEVSGSSRNYMREQLRLGLDEKVYGFGERFGHFVKNGQTVEMWNSDAGTSSDAVYKEIPFYWTNKGYGVFVNHPEDVSFEVGSETVGKVQFSTRGERLEYYVIAGPEPKDVLRRYTALTGRAPYLPSWSYGLWLTTSFLTDYDDDTVAGFVDGMRDRDIPLSVFHYDCYWLRPYHWCDFEWDGDMFHDPRGTIAEHHRKGLKVCVWINPYLSSVSPLYDEAVDGGYLIRLADGSPYATDFWQPGMGLVDFTNPEAREWYCSKLGKLLDMGVDCFKTDFGESAPTDVVYHDGSDPIAMHNYYTYLYNQTVYRYLEQRQGKGEAVLFARSATVGGQQFPVHWGGDCESSYAAMAESLRGGLSLMSSGFGFWAHDIGGFEGDPGPDLYKRWVQFGLLSTHSRLHGSKTVRVPWAFDEESCDVLRRFTKLKLSLLPYLARGSQQVSEEGVPLMRPMALEFPHDPAAQYLDRQYMLGDDLLVAPVFSPDGTVEYYVPEGEWTNYLTGETVVGPKWVTGEFDYMSLPLMVRPGAVIAVQENRNDTEGDLLDDATLKVFSPEALADEGKTVVLRRGFEEDAPCVEFHVRRVGSTVEATCSDPTLTWTLACGEARGVVESGKASVMI
ncbi:alpha-glucosidase [Bifidobacterium lemurum]|uniref:alpha-D-xyloside xylohydrolase n=1 Tax=Bifidobacterium lemurum TaxID=1603886 RepID=A0A261FS79_9BIFI|nr:alpha-xylosidase [Bifidobacterium lemurum]OZG61803.1 alpha-glucosidase [Bifidobacterium lemurum]QOL34951.1 alpha-xylosidase [Bifidobacterium lemurum]